MPQWLPRGYVAPEEGNIGLEVLCDAFRVPLRLVVGGFRDPLDEARHRSAGRFLFGYFDPGRRPFAPDDLRHVFQCAEHREFVGETEERGPRGHPEAVVFPVRAFRHARHRGRELQRIEQRVVEQLLRAGKAKTLRLALLESLAKVLGVPARDLIAESPKRARR